MPIKPQGYDPTGNQMADAKVATNCYTVNVQVNDSGEQRKWGVITVFKDNVSIIPKHFITRMEKAVEDWDGRSSYLVSFRQFSGNRHFNMKVSEILDNAFKTAELDEQDLCLLRLPRGTQPHPDIVKYFFDESNFSKLRGSLHTRLDTHNGRHKTHIGKGILRNAIPVESKSEEMSYVITRAVEYDLPATFGDCGSIVVFLNAGLQNNIFGFVHACGRGTAGWGSIVTKQMLERSFSQFPKLENIITQNFPFFDSQPTAPHGPNPLLSKFRYVKRLPQSFGLGGVHHLVKSKMYGKLEGFPSVKKPSRLFAGSEPGQDPKINCYSKYCNNKTELDTKLLRKVICAKYDQLEAKDPNPTTPRDLWTSEMAVLGIPEEREAGPLNMATSMGYPWCKDFKSKADFFGFPVDLNQNRVQKLFSDSDLRIEQMNKGIKPEYIFIDFLKAELLKISKVDSYDTRLISGAPIEMIIDARKLCGAFSTMILRSRIKNNSCLGITEVSDEWELLMRHLTTFSRKIFAGDYKAFDGSHTYQLIMAICDLINMWYKDSNSEARRQLFMCIARSWHIVGDEVFEWEGGMPSGNPLTSIINTIINEVLMRYSYESLVPNTQETPFDSHVVAAYVGDDNAVGVSERVLPYFNEIALCNFMPTIGYTYTSETKETSLEPTRPYTSIEFLKRKFRFEPLLGIHVAPIREETLIEMVQWTNNTDPDNIIASKVQTVVREYSLHGEEIFKQRVPMILKAYRENYGSDAIWPTSTDFMTVLDEVMYSPPSDFL
nr:non-structural polyprotein [Flumine dicistrovirus 15]